MNATKILGLCLPSMLLAAGLAGCSGSSSSTEASGSNAPLGATDLTLGSSGHPELTTFTTVVQSIGFVLADGTRTLPMNAADIEVEWVGLADAQMWIGHAELAAGDYAGIYVTFDRDGTRGVLTSGESVAFETTLADVVLPFDGALSIPAGGAAPSHLSLDLLASIVSSGTRTFRPVGGAVTELPPRPIDTLFGVVRSVTGADTFVIEAFEDVELRRSLGPLGVGLADAFLLVDDGGELFDSPAAFFGSLRPGLTLLELEGMLTSDFRLSATRVEIVDQALGDGRTLPVRIEGQIQARDPLGFELRVRRVLAGSETARPVLERLDRPGVISVAVDDATRILGGGPDAVLEVGRSVVVEFREFIQEPFPADVVILRDSRPCFSGTMAAGDLSDSITLLLRPDTPDGAPVRLPVLLGAARIELLTRTRPPLQPRDLITGMNAEACGQLRDTSAGRVLVARSIQVSPGHYVRGTVVSHDRARGTFHTRTGVVLRSFGPLVDSGPLDVHLRDRVLVHGGATTVAGFFDVLEAATDDEIVLIEVQGIGGNAPDVIQAFQLGVKVLAATDSE